MRRHSDKDLQKAVQRTARAFRSHSERAVRYHGKDGSPKYADVIDLSPLTVEMHGSNFILAEEDLVLSQWVERYDKDHGIDRGDVLIVHLMEDGDYLASDVVSQKTV